MLREIAKITPKFHSGILAVRNIHPVASKEPFERNFFSWVRSRASMSPEKPIRNRLAGRPCAQADCSRG